MAIVRINIVIEMMIKNVHFPNCGFNVVGCDQFGLEYLKKQMMAGDGTHKTAESDFSAALGSRRIAAVTFRERIRKRREEKNKVQEKKEEK